MKTITEYQPLIFSRILGATRKMGRERRVAGWNAGVIIFYCAAGSWLFVDTGFAPWNWQFWTAFAPLFIAGELAVNEVFAMAEHRRNADAP